MKSSILKKRSERKRQKQSRRIQKINEHKRKRHNSKNVKLTDEQKRIRAEKLKKRVEIKILKKQFKSEKIESENATSLHKVIFSVFDACTLDQLARTTGFIKRGGLITAFSFIYLLSFGFYGNGRIALTYLVSILDKKFEIDITPQALCKRINSASSVNFLKSVVLKLIESQILAGVKNRFTATFSIFSGIYLQDSSQMILNEILENDYQGAGGCSSKSSLKLDFIYDIMNLVVIGIKITGGVTPDQFNSREIMKYLKARALIIRDLGYFGIDTLKKIQDKGVFYLSRLPISLNVFLNKDDKQPINIVNEFKKLIKDNNGPISLKIYLGNEKFETRLVAEKVPSEVTEKRRTRYKIKHKKEPSEYYMEWFGYSIFITNIPIEIFSGKMIIAMYKIRWQIELVFKNFKSNIEINVLKGINKYRIESLVYGKLITIITIFIIQQYTANIAPEMEVSGDKLTKWLKADNRLHQAIIMGKLILLLKELECEIPLVTKQKRKRKTTCEYISTIFEAEKEVNQETLNLSVA